MLLRSFSAAILGLAAALLPLPTASATPQYRLTVIGPARAISGAASVNNRGIFAGGVSATKGHPSHYALFVRGRQRPIANLGSSRSFASPASMNDSGLLVGTVGRRAALFEDRKPRVLFDLLAPQSAWQSFSYATDINNAGQIVGVGRRASDGAFRTFLYQNGVATDLGDLGFGGSPEASSINNLGQAVGAARAKQGKYHAVLFDRGTVQDLGSLSDDYSLATGINDRGQIIGYSRLANGAIHSFRSENGVLRDLGMLPGFRSSFASALNELGHVVGSVSRPHSPETHGFIYRESRLHDLNDLVVKPGGWTVIDATDINDRGVIAATGEDASGRQVAIRLSPLPR